MPIAKQYSPKIDILEEMWRMSLSLPYLKLSVADLGIDGRRGATGGVEPHIGGLRLCPERRCRGMWLGVWGR